jgi:homoserine dehydrogenase
MSAQPTFLTRRDDTAMAMLGIGGVGTALLRQLATPAAAGLRLVALADSRHQLVHPDGLAPAQAASRLAEMAQPNEGEGWRRALDDSGARRRVIVDATASDEVAARHAAWLAAGYHVVSANKAALGGSGRAWSAVQRMRGRDASYGDAATVGAGLPVLSTLRRLRECGDNVLAIEGVFSGSLSWLFNRFDGSRPFSALLREARAWGYTEPDPRVDLEGVDVVRKLLILARCAGYELEPAGIERRGLVPEELRAIPPADFLARTGELDEVLERRRRLAARNGRVLRFLASLDRDGARVGLVEVGLDHPAARLDGADNLFALTTDRYRERPLLIQGPGAGVDVTAQALLGDVLAVHRRAAP